MQRTTCSQKIKSTFDRRPAATGPMDEASAVRPGGTSGTTQKCETKKEHDKNGAKTNKTKTKTKTRLKRKKRSSKNVQKQNDRHHRTKKVGRKWLEKKNEQNKQTKQIKQASKQTNKHTHTLTNKKGSHCRPEKVFQPTCAPC